MLLLGNTQKKQSRDLPAHGNRPDPSTLEKSSMNI